MSEAVCIGRFQLPHKGHIQLIKQALSAADHVTIVIGSADKCRTNKNPFSWVERSVMISLCLTDEDLRRIDFKPVRDHGDDNVWLNNVHSSTSGNHDKIFLVGHNKDESSYYLDLFKDWEFVDIKNVDGLHSTDMREVFYNDVNKLDPAKVPQEIINYLKEKRDEFNFND